MCLGLFNGDGKGHSLLKESKLKNSTAAIRSVKLNDNMLKASRVPIKPAVVVKPIQVASTPEERRSIRLERKGLVEIARIKKEDGGVENAAETDNTKPEVKNDAQEDTEKTAQDETMNEVQDDTKSEVQDDINEETQSVASTVKSKPKEKELKVVKKKRIASFKNRVRNVKSEESMMAGSSVVSSRRQQHPQIRNLGENQDGSFTLTPKSQATNQEGGDVNTLTQTTASLERKDSELKKEENQNNSLTDKEDMKGEMAKLGNDVSNILDPHNSEDEDILSTSMNLNTSTNESWIQRTPVPGDGSVRSDERAMAREKPSTGNDATPITREGSITDLTHIDDDRSLEGLPSLPSLKLEDGSSPIEETGLGGNKNKKIEVIDVFEFDDQDSWTPGEERRALSPSTSKHSVRKSAFEKSRDPSPSKSTHTSRTSRDPTPSKAKFANTKENDIARRVIDIWEEEEEKLKAFSTTRNFSQGARPQEPKLKTSSRKKIFDDPLIREEFAGHRRGRLEDAETAKESRRSRSKSQSRRQREGEKAPTPEDASVVSRKSRRSKSLEARHRLDELELENTLRKSASRDSRYKETQPTVSRVTASPVSTLDHRQWAIESRNPSREAGRHEERGGNESPATKKKGLVAVRSIDEGQRLRTPRRNQELREKADTRAPPAKSRDNSTPEAIQYGIYPTKSRETRHPIDVQSEQKRISLTKETRDSDIHQTRIHGMLNSRSVRGSKSLHEREDRGVRPSGSRDYAEVISSTHGMLIHASKRRDTHEGRGRSMGRDRQGVVDVTDIQDDYDIRKSREGGDVDQPKSRDARDDHGTRHSTRHSKRRSAKEDPSGHSPDIDKYQDEPGGREKRSSRSKSKSKDDPGVISTSKELRRLEKKLGKQILQVKQDLARKPAEWDERSVYSSKDLRKLEKRLVQKLKHEDEKRAVRLKRLRLKRESHKVNSDDLGISEKVPTKTISQKADATRLEKSKYDQLKVLTRGASPLRPEGF
jgi:hypothetical protein